MSRVFALVLTGALAALAAPTAALADDAVPVSQLPSAWTPLLSVLVPAAVASLLFLQAFVRLRRRGRSDHASWTRLALFACGMAALTLPLVSPLDPISDSYLLSGHMLEHVLIGDAAPALLLVALRGPLLFFFLPAPILGPLARLRPLRTALAFLLRPRVAMVAWAVVIGAWHIPAAYDYTLSHQTVHDLEHLTFAIVGLLVWTQLIDPARRAELTTGGRLGYAAVLFAMGTVLSDVLIFSQQPLYPAYAHAETRLFGLSPLRDQQLAGLVMLFEQLLTLGTCAALLLRPLLRNRRNAQTAATVAGAIGD